VQRSDLDRDMRITSRSEYGRMFALYDNRDAAELAHLARIEEQVAITKIDLPYTRHDTHRCFSELEALTQLVALCRKGDAASARAFARRQRKSVSARAFNLGLILAEVSGVDVVVDIAVALIPLLVVVLLVMLVSGMYGEVFSHPRRQLQLLIGLVQQYIILLGDHSVAVAAVLREDLEAYGSFELLPRRTLPESYVPKNSYCGHLRWPWWVPTSVTCSS